MPYYPASPGLYPPDGSITTVKLADDAVTDAKLANMPEGTVKGRALGAGTGDPTNLTLAQLQAMVGLSHRNILGRNGGFEVWQRGAGGAAAMAVLGNSGAYTADGWWVQAAVNAQIYAGQDAPLANGSRHCGIFTRYPGQTGTGTCNLEYPLDTDEIVTARGSIVTLAATIKSGAQWPVGGVLSCYLITGTGAPARFSTTIYTGRVDLIATSFPLTTTATRFVATSSIPVPANVMQATVLFQWTPVGTAGANDGFWIDDVQLEIGSVATPFERRPFESELLACRRHFFKTFPYNVAPAQNAGRSGEHYFSQVTGAASAQVVGNLRYPVQMRVIPSITVFNPAAANAFARNHSIASDFTSTVVDGGVSQDGLQMFGNTAPGSATGHGCGVHIAADAGI